jgi:CheY-like chemotaxis protein
MQLSAVAPFSFHKTGIRMTILVIEDDEVARIGLGSILRSQGYLVHLAANSDEAVVHLQTESSYPDLILLDMIQPGWCDGWQFLGQRQRGLLPNSIPVVIMTGLGIATLPWARALGAVDLLLKPIAVEGLLEMVQRHAAEKSLAQVE